MKPAIANLRRGAERSQLKKEIAGFSCASRGGSQFDGAVASATEVMPCSSAAFVTAMTTSYGVSRSALMMIGRPSFSSRQERAELLERDFLIAKINRRVRAAGDADDLLDSAAGRG